MFSFSLKYKYIGIERVATSEESEEYFETKKIVNQTPVKINP
jgi:hypothetical protein